MVGFEAPEGLDGQRHFLENAPYCRQMGPSSAPDEADPGDLVEVECGMFGLEVDDEATDGGGQDAPFCRLRTEEAPHAVPLEARGPPVERPLGGPGLGRSFGHRLAEEDQRPDPLVLPLLLPGAKKLQLLPVVGPVHASSSPLPHPSPLQRTVCGQGSMPHPGLYDHSRRSNPSHRFCQAPLQPGVALFLA